MSSRSLKVMVDFEVEAEALDFELDFEAEAKAGDLEALVSP